MIATPPTMPLLPLVSTNVRGSDAKFTIRGYTFHRFVQFPGLVNLWVANAHAVALVDYIYSLLLDESTLKPKVYMLAYLILLQIRKAD